MTAASKIFMSVNWEPYEVFQEIVHFTDLETARDAAVMGATLEFIDVHELHLLPGGVEFELKLIHRYDRESERWTRLIPHSEWEE